MSFELNKHKELDGLLLLEAVLWQQIHSLNRSISNFKFYLALYKQVGECILDLVESILTIKVDRTALHDNMNRLESNEVIFETNNGVIDCNNLCPFTRKPLIDPI